VAQSANAVDIVNRSMARSILRWIHIALPFRCSAMFIVRWTKSQTAPPRLGLSSFLSWSS